MQKVLIIGSSGNLGYQIYKEIKKIKKIQLFHTGLKRRKFNLTRETEIKKLILSIYPDLIINCIAYTSIDKCENYEFISKQINFGIVKKIFKLKKEKKLKFNFIHFSTDQFYNQKGNKSSSENAKISLLNNYCIQKRMAEVECIKNRSLIFRINFFGKSNKYKTFSDWVFYSFKKKKKIYLFNDVYFNPLRIKTIAKIISFIIKKNKFNYSGIYNLGSKNKILKSDFALLFAKKTKVIKKNYNFIKINELLKVRRSNNMYMDVSKFEKKFQLKLPNINYEVINEAKEY